MMQYADEGAIGQSPNGMTSLAESVLKMEGYYANIKIVQLC